MKVEQKFYEAIAAGITDGFKEIEFDLNEREKKIIFLTTIAAITIAERFKEKNIQFKEDQIDEKG